MCFLSLRVSQTDQRLSPTQAMTQDAARGHDMHGGPHQHALERCLHGLSLSRSSFPPGQVGSQGAGEERIEGLQGAAGPGPGQQIPVPTLSA